MTKTHLIETSFCAGTSEKVRLSGQIYASFDMAGSPQTHLKEQSYEASINMEE